MMATGTLAHLLSALSAECDDLSFRVEALHEALAPAGAGMGSVHAAQGIDYVQQHLCALAEFLMMLSEATPPTIRADLQDALQTVRLADLRHRLAGTRSSEPAAAVFAGEPEWF